MGDQMQTVAIAWQLYALTHSAVSLGLIGVASFLPVVLFSLVGGLSADKVNRKKLLFVCQTILTILALILFIGTHFNFIAPWMIYVVLGLAAVVKSFNNPARQSISINLVPRDVFINAVSLTTLQRQSATILGPAIAGFLIAFLGVESVYLYNSISFLALMIVFLVIKIPQPDKEKIASFSLKSIVEGIQFVAKKPIIHSTMILDFLATFFGTSNILMPIFARDILNVGPQGLGFLYSAPAMGGVLAGIYFSGKHTLTNQGKIIIGSVLLYGAAIIGFGLSRIYLLSLFFLFLMGMGDMISTIIRNTTRQLLTPDHLRGRMVSINMLFTQGGSHLGDGEAGFLAHFAGAPIATVIGGTGTILITLLIAKFYPSLRKYKGEEVEI
jgi:MFS family permease